jgi:DNA-binding MarR family transcriptional regulator
MDGARQVASQQNALTPMLDIQQLLDLDDLWHSLLGQAVLRPSARLILQVAIRGTMSVKEAMHDSALSHRAFYNVLESLKSQGVIQTSVDERDGRVRRLALAERWQDSLAHHLQSIPKRPLLHVAALRASS